MGLARTCQIGGRPRRITTPHQRTANNTAEIALCKKNSRFKLYLRQPAQQTARQNLEGFLSPTVDVV